MLSASLSVFRTHDTWVTPLRTPVTCLGKYRKNRPAFPVPEHLSFQARVFRRLLHGGWECSMRKMSLTPILGHDNAMARCDAQHLIEQHSEASKMEFLSDL